MNNKFFGLLLLVGLLFNARTVGAQTPTPRIIGNEAVVEYPNSITFELTVDSIPDGSSAILQYDVIKFGCTEVRRQVPVVIEEGRAEWTWNMVRSGNNPPPGTKIWWEWEISDATGAVVASPPQSIRLGDNRFEWRSVHNDGVAVHWYEGQDVGPLLLDAASGGLARLEEEMGIELVGDVDIYVYGSSDDMKEAVLNIQDWAGAVAFPDYGTILMGVPPSIAADWGTSTVKHELAHLVVGQYGRSCVGGSRPTWLEEGLAMVAEGEPDSTIVEDIRQGVEKDTFEPVRSLNGAFPAHSSAASMAYSQSYSLVSYMLDSFGPEKMQALISLLATGEDYDEALETIYGFNIDGLEVAWRQALGAPQRVIPPTPTAISASAIATIPPQSIPDALPTPSNYQSREPVAGPTICGLGLIPLVGLIIFSSLGPKVSGRSERRRRP